MKGSIIISILVVFLVVAELSSCSAQSQATVQEFEQEMKANNIVLLDVRTPQEFRSGYIPNAINIDIYDNDFQSKALSLDKSKTILVYCRSGSRSAQATNLLRKNGYKVVDMRGGIGAWSAAGKKIIN
jgi:rhodanese-related sulfurtransferase